MPAPIVTDPAAGTKPQTTLIGTAKTMVPKKAQKSKSAETQGSPCLDKPVLGQEEGWGVTIGTCWTPTDRPHGPQMRLMGVPPGGTRQPKVGKLYDHSAQRSWHVGGCGTCGEAYAPSCHEAELHSHRSNVVRTIGEWRGAKRKYANTSRASRRHPKGSG